MFGSMSADGGSDRAPRQLALADHHTYWQECRQHPEVRPRVIAGSNATQAA